MLNKEDLKNIGTLLATGKFNLTGQEAGVVDALLKKVITAYNGMPDEIPEEKKTEEVEEVK